MARQSAKPRMMISVRGYDFTLGVESSAPWIAKYLAEIVAPGATWEIFDDPLQAVRLAVEHLAGRHEVDRKRLQGCFDRIVGQACGGVLPRGGELFQLFSTGPLSWPQRVLGCKEITSPLGFLEGLDFIVLA